MRQHASSEVIACLAIIGSRSLDPRVPVRSAQAKANERKAFRVLDRIHAKTPILSVVSGGAAGPDTWAKNWAKSRSVEYIEYLPDWNKHKRAAGFIRNADIVNDCTRLLAFWDGVSRGTDHSIGLAKKQSKPRKVVIMEAA